MTPLLDRVQRLARTVFGEHAEVWSAAGAWHVAHRGKTATVAYPSLAALERALQHLARRGPALRA